MSAQKTLVYDLTEGSVAKKLLLFSYPFMLANLLQLVYNLVDMVVIGHFGGSIGQTAVSIGGDLLNFCTMACVGFCNAGQVIIAQGVGKKDSQAVKETIGTMFTVLLSAALVLSVITLLLTDSLLFWMNTPEIAFSQARSYSLVCFAGLVFVFGYNVVSSILRGMGDSKRPLMFIAIAAFLNLVLDLLLIAVFHLGALGAALATVMGQAVSFIISLIYLYRRKEAFGFDFKRESFKIKASRLIPIVKLGLPMALQSSAISFSTLFVKSHVNSFGLIAATVTGVGDKLRNLMSIITRSMSAAGSSMVGQNMGAGKPERVKKMVSVAFIICFSACFVLSAAVLLFPRAIFSIFNTEPEVLDLAEKYMPSLAIAFFSFASMAPFNAVINGTGFATLGMFGALMDGVVARIGLSLLFGLTLGWGIQGFWYGSALAGFVMAAVGGAYFFSGKWKTRKLLIK